jgi:phage baseplate assembly protein W
VHPNKQDLVLHTNEDAVKRSIRNIILTDRGERMFNPLIGSNIRSLLFENFSPQTASLLRDFIKSAIENFEPRATVIDVYVQALPDESAYAATIVFSVINKTEPVTLELLLNRVR